MNREDTLTFNAFLTAVTQLQEPLPASIVTQLEEISKHLPESIAELHELTEQFEPLHQQYRTAICEQPSEGEIVKFVETPVGGSSSKNFSPSDYFQQSAYLLPTSEQMQQWLLEIVELAQEDALDLLHSRVVEQEVLDLLDES